MIQEYLKNLLKNVILLSYYICVCIYITWIRKVIIPGRLIAGIENILATITTMSLMTVTSFQKELYYTQYITLLYMYMKNIMYYQKLESAENEIESLVDRPQGATIFISPISGPLYFKLSILCSLYIHIYECVCVCVNTD